jgi:hypothetical protein
MESFGSRSLNLTIRDVSGINRRDLRGSCFTNSTSCAISLGASSFSEQPEIIISKKASKLTTLIFILDALKS